MRATYEACIKVNVAESQISVYNQHNIKITNILGGNAIDELFVAINGPEFPIVSSSSSTLEEPPRISTL